MDALEQPDANRNKRHTHTPGELDQQAAGKRPRHRHASSTEETQAKSKRKKCRAKIDYSKFELPDDPTTFNSNGVLLCFDLNGVLIRRSKSKLVCKETNTPLPVNFRDRTGKYVYLRPHALSLLYWCIHIRKFKVAVWTSATKDVAHQLVEFIFTSGKLTPSDCSFVFCVEQCVPVRQGRAVVKTKPLGTIYRTFPHFNRANTLLIDDSPQKIYREDRLNVYHPNEFSSDAASNSSSAAFKDDFGQDGMIWMLLDMVSRLRPGEDRVDQLMLSYVT